MSSENRGKLSVLMPVFNERRTLRTIVDRVLNAPVEMEIELLCVDDFSTDGSLPLLLEIAETDSRIIVLRHEANRGKGAAIRTAIDYMSGDIAIVQDSDLEYDPRDFPKILQPILDGRADAVFGSRFASSSERRILLYWHSLGNRLLTWLTNVLNDLNLTDMETCYKAVTADVLKDLRLRSDRFGIEPEITTRLAQWGARIYEVPISYHGRGYDEGKNIGWRDGVQAFWLLLRFRFIDSAHSVRATRNSYETAPVPRRVSRWTFDQFGGHLGSRVLELGVGTGNVTRHMLDRELLVGVDSSAYEVRALDRRWGHLENVRLICGQLDDPMLIEKLPGPFDSVVAINSLEHLDNFQLALEAASSSLVPNGNLIVAVPAHRWLFSDVDRVIGHRRRFERNELARTLHQVGFDVESIKEFNRLAALGWMINKALRARRWRSWQVRLFGLILPLVRLVEKIRFLPGLSYIAFARKPLS